MLIAAGVMALAKSLKKFIPTTKIYWNLKFFQEE